MEVGRTGWKRWARWRTADLLRYYADDMEKNEGYTRRLGKLNPDDPKENNFSVLRPYVLGGDFTFNFPMALSAARFRRRCWQATRWSSRKRARDALLQLEGHKFSPRPVYPQAHSTTSARTTPWPNGCWTIRRQRLDLHRLGCGGAQGHAGGHQRAITSARPSSRWAARTRPS
ncbi:MAG: hypothetical protein R3A10_08310 [Caldilineaceae bacterium]